MFFFFQAEDGIRDLTVTGVQTCALPILTDLSFSPESRIERYQLLVHVEQKLGGSILQTVNDERPERSEEHTSDSSHSQISYAVFCLKKKKNLTSQHTHHDFLHSALAVPQ